jgi:hypothetical protein
MGKEGFAHHAAVDRLFRRRRLNDRALAGPATQRCSTLFIESVEQHGRGILSDG